MADILDAGQTTQSDPTMPVPPPEPVKDTILPPSYGKLKKKKVSPAVIITGIILLLITLPVAVFFIANPKSLADIRGHACGADDDCPKWDKPPKTNPVPPTPTPVPITCTSFTTVHINDCDTAAKYTSNPISPDCKTSSSDVTLHLSSGTATTVRVAANVPFATQCTDVPDASFGASSAYAATKSVTIPEVAGDTKVCVMVKDAAGSSAKCGGTIYYTATTPGKPTVTIDCSGATPVATIAWVGGTPKDFDVNIFSDVTGANYYTKSVGKVQTTDSSGFFGSPGSPLIHGDPLVLEPDTTYYVSVWNGKLSQNNTFTIDSCSPTPTPIPTETPEPTSTPTPVPTATPTPVQQAEQPGQQTVYVNTTPPPDQQQIVYVNPTSAPIQQVNGQTPITPQPTPKTPVSGGPTVLGVSVIGIGTLILILGLAL